MYLSLYMILPLDLCLKGPIIHLFPLCTGTFECVQVPKLVLVLELFSFDFFRYFNKRRKTCRLSSCINRHLSKKVHKINNYRHSHTFKHLKKKTKPMCVSAFFYFFVLFLCVNDIIITFQNNVCS
jgi:hypothetical protein